MSKRVRNDETLLVPIDPISMEEVEGEAATALPNKEVLSLLDINVNVDLGLDLAAPVDLAAAANLNVAAPIEAAATANVLSPDAIAVGEAAQHGTLDQTISGTADATAPQHAMVTQSTGATPSDATAPQHAGMTQGTAPADATAPQHAATPQSGAPVSDAAGTTSPVPSTGTDTAAGTTSGGVDSLLNGGSLLDANVTVHATANLAAPIDGAVAVNGNVAAPVDAAVGANIGSPGAVAEAVAPQDLDISQSLDHVTADATAVQNADVAQQ